LGNLFYFRVLVMLRLFAKIGFLITALFILFSSDWNAQTSPDSLRQIEYYKKIVYTLADDSMCGREVSSLYEYKAAQFIKQEIKKIKGIKPLTHEFIYQTNDTAVAMSSRNIYCFINNKADSTVLISAHYEHIGRGGKLTYALGKKNQIHNGADDNASGVALALSLLKDSKRWQSKTVNYAFVFYSAHEIGLYGSTAFQVFCKLKFPPIRAVLNFDMVGRLDLSYLPQITFYGARTISETQREEIKAKATTVKYDMDKSSTIYNSDCRAFLKDSIPCLWVTTGSHNDYHRPEDDAKYIKYDGIYVIQTILETQVLKSSVYRKSKR
jgi:Zn-dependent M28 family amino/carboxypeptidase